MTSPADRLAPLRRRAALLEDRAAQALSAALSRHAQAEARHAELCRYEAEYAERDLPTATAIGALRQQAAFLARLREAVRFQAEVSRRCAEELERVRACWLETHQEVEKLDRLVSQLAREAQRQDARRQGREMDEAAIRSHLARGHRLAAGAAS